VTTSGLSDHATVHHGCWYSAKQDRYVPIPAADLVAKHRRVREGQAHRKCRVYPADVDVEQGKTVDAKRHLPAKHTSTCCRLPSSGARASKRTALLPLVVRTTRSEGLAELWLAPSRHGHRLGGSWGAPVAKLARPAGFPKAASGPSCRRPAPKEDDRITGVHDEHGLTPKLRWVYRVSYRT